METVPESFEQTMKQILQERKVAFADKEDEAAFIRRAAEKAGRGENCYFPFGFTFTTVPKLAFAHFPLDKD